jgi:cell division protein FtsN
VYFVQAGAFQSSDDAEQQRAKLAILGVETKLIEREQSGRTVFRVRAGPYTKQPDAEGVRDKLLSSGVEAMLVRVERQP